MLVCLGGAIALVTLTFAMDRFVLVANVECSSSLSAAPFSVKATSVVSAKKNLVPLLDGKISLEPMPTSATLTAAIEIGSRLTFVP